MPAKVISVTVGGKETPSSHSAQVSHNELLRITNKAQRNVSRLINKELKQYKLNLAQWLLLGLIFGKGNDGIGVTAAAKELGISTPQITVASQDLIARHALRQRIYREDRRGKKLYITARGRVIFTDSEVAVSKVIAKLLQATPSGHLHFYHRISTAMANMSMVSDDTKR